MNRARSSRSGMRLSGRVRRGVLTALLSAAFAPAQDGFDDYGPKPTGVHKAQAQHEENLETYRANPDVMVLPGLVADRKARRVEVLAEYTGLAANEIVEFLLIDQGSSHGYEGMLWAFAKPSDVHRALLFIGLKPGAPFNPRVMRFWADGDRVNVGIRLEQSDVVPIERLVLDTETGTTLPEEGFVFAGSLNVPSPDGSGEQRYAADVYDPRSIASIYNEPAAVLDVPRRISQEEAYGRQVVNPETGLAAGQMVTVVMTPGDSDGRPPPRRVRLSVEQTPDTGVIFHLSGTGGVSVAQGPDLTRVLQELVALRGEGAPPYVELTFAEDVPVTVAAKTAQLVAMLESMGLARVNPPAADALYYRAFVPDMQWLKPEGRPSQPWELHLSAQHGKAAAHMVWNEPVWSNGSSTPTYRRHAVQTPTPDAVRETLDAHAREREKAGKRPAPSVLLVFAAPGLTYGQMLAFVKPVLNTHGTVYVFSREQDNPIPGAAER